jgi:hypothetical protein
MSNVSLNGRAAFHEVHKYVKLIKRMAELNYDIRRLNYLRISLLRENNTETDFIPYTQFVTQSTRILSNVKDFQESDILATMKELLTEPKVPGDPNPRDEDLMFSLPRFGLLVELYHYFPILYKKDQNLSTQLYYILSSNKKGNAEKSSQNVSESARGNSEERGSDFNRLQGMSKTVMSGSFFKAGSVQENMKILSDKVRSEHCVIFVCIAN